MAIHRLDPDRLTDALLAQMLDMENASGLEPWPEEVLRAYITHAETFLCTDGDTVAGFIIVQRDEDYGFGGLHISNLNVAAPYRRKGIAQRMIRTACTQCAAEYAGHPVSLDVEKSNQPARRLYEKLGFTACDIPSENGPDDLVMTAPLDTLLL